MTTTLHIVSGKADVRESFSSEIFAPIKRRGFHFETVYAPLWLAGRALMRWQLDAPLKGTRLRSRVQGDMGQRMRAELGGLGAQEGGGEIGVKRVGRGEGLYLRGGQRWEQKGASGVSDIRLDCFRVRLMTETVTVLELWIDYLVVLLYY